MRRLIGFALLAASIAVGGCGSEPAPTSPGTPPEPLQPSGCAPGEVTLAGGDCRPAGVPPDACGTGFVAEDQGCVAILPPEPCGAGQMALPGETVCRPVAVCPDGAYGDATTGPGTQFVDTAYVGTDSDGSVAKPWRQIQAAVDAAATGAVVAIAEGTYNEDVIVVDKPVHLWGRCPSLVKLHGVTEHSALEIGPGASGTGVTNLQITGPKGGIFVGGVDGVLVEQVWIHDTGDRGIDSAPVSSSTEFTVRGCLVELAQTVGVFAGASKLAVEDTVVRDILPVGGLFGRGIQLEGDTTSGQRATGTIRHSIIERTRDIAITLAGSDAVIEETLIRDTQAEVANQIAGRGIDVHVSSSGERSSLSIRASVVEQSFDGGIVVWGSSLEMDTTVVRDTRAAASDGFRGWGVFVFDGHLPSAFPASATITASLVERSQQAGVLFGGAEATVEGIVVRDTAPAAADQELGLGIGVEGHAETKSVARLTLRGSVLERNHTAGLCAVSAIADLDRVAIRDTLPQAANEPSARGLIAQSTVHGMPRTELTMRASTVERSAGIGVLIIEADAVLDEVSVRDVSIEPSTGTFGDGFAIMRIIDGAKVSLTRSWVGPTARAGISNFGSQVTLADTILECNGLHLDAEDDGVKPQFEDGGGNTCGCQGTAAPCKALTSSLEAPPPLPGSLSPP